MIRGMVERLAQRLEQHPDDKAGWERLAHAYDVLGEPDKAQMARARAAATETARRRQRAAAAGERGNQRAAEPGQPHRLHRQRPLRQAMRKGGSNGRAPWKARGGPPMRSRH